MIGRLAAVVLDCPDPRTLAAFYSALTGWAVRHATDEWVTLGNGGDLTLCLQGVADHRPPRWPDPDHPQQAHLDLRVDDLDRAEEQVLALGATLLQTPHPTYRVYADPVGHPFCLSSG